MSDAWPAKASGRTAVAVAHFWDGFAALPELETFPTRTAVCSNDCCTYTHVVPLQTQRDRSDTPLATGGEWHFPVGT